MKEKSENLTSRLHLMISSLSRKDKQHFSSLTGNSKNSHFVKIFDRFAKSKTDPSEKLCETYFNGDRKAFLSSCRYLIGKILDQLAAKESSGKIEIAKIELAIEFGFHKLARFLISKNVLEATRNEDLESLLHLFELIEFLKVHYGIDFPMAEKVPDYHSVLKESHHLASLKLAYQELKMALSGSNETKKEACEKWQQLITTEEKSVLFQETNYYFLKLRVIYFRQIDSFGKAIEEQKKIIDLLENTQFLPIEQVLIEHRFMVFFNVYEENESDALRALFKLGMVDTPSLSLQKQMTMEWVKCTLYICAVFRKPDLERKIKAEFQKIKNAYSSRWKAILYYWMAIMELSNENWEEVILLQNRIMALPDKAKAGIEAISPLLKAICCLERGDQYEAKMVLSRHQGRIAQYDKKYPILCSEILSELANPLISELEQHRIYTSAYQQLIELSFDPDELSLISLFDILPWLRSKVNNVPISEYLKANPLERWIHPNIKAS